MRFIKHSHKVIVSDAVINDNVFELLKSRLNDEVLYIENHFKKYQDVKACRVRDENEFLNLLMDHCRDNKYFLFGCDSCTTVTKYHDRCKSQADEADKDKFILITSKNPFVIVNASQQFKNKFAIDLR